MKYRSNTCQTLVKYRSNTGQILVKRALARHLPSSVRRAWGRLLTSGFDQRLTSDRGLTGLSSIATVFDRYLTSILTSFDQLVLTSCF